MNSDISIMYSWTSANTFHYNLASLEPLKTLVVIVVSVVENIHRKNNFILSQTQLKICMVICYFNKQIKSNLINLILLINQKIAKRCVCVRVKVINYLISLR